MTTILIVISIWFYITGGIACLTHMNSQRELDYRDYIVSLFWPVIIIRALGLLIYDQIKYALKNRKEN